MNNFKENILKDIRLYADKITSFGRDIYEHPEMGFCEYRTQSKVKEVFEELGLEITAPLALTGIKGVLKGAHSGPTVAILGEMDGLLCKNHHFSDRETGAAHICGHNAQLAAMIGALYLLKNNEIVENLHGNIVFMATPAEEYVELEKRRKLKEEGKIGFLAGKPELIRIGAFDDIELALITHVASDVPGKRFGLGGTANGFLAKSVWFIGKPAHAGGAPDKGRNALQAATIALNAINAWRETFKDDLSIRVHPIMTTGGELVNIVPGEAKLELYIRGRTLEAILETEDKINRSLQAGGLAMGCKVIIDNLPGFLPQYSSTSLVEVIRENARLLVDDNKIVANGHFEGSADMGDITQLMPGTIIEVGGIKGSPHTANFEIVDEKAAYLLPAVLMALTVVDLMVGSNKKAREIIEVSSKPLSKEDYLKLIEDFFSQQIHDYLF